MKNLYTIENVEQFRKELIAECRQKSCDCESIGLEEMACYYDEKAESYRYMPLDDLAAFMAYTKGGC